MANLAKSAEWYAARMGWYVVPLHSPTFDGDGRVTGCTCEPWRRENRDPGYICPTPGKHPRMGAWEDKASNDPIQVRKWWRAWPTANVGIATGRSGLLVIDADTYKEGADAMRLPETVTSLTGGGGEHWLYKMPEGTRYGNADGELPPWLDIRGWGGQIVAPPSIHPTGNRYCWEDGYGPHEHALAPLPESIEQLLKPVGERVAVQFGNVTSVPPDLDTWRLPAITRALITDDRSRLAQSVITTLVRAGAGDDDIRAVFAHYPVGGKYADMGTDADRWLAHSIGSARSWLATHTRPERSQL